MNHMCPACGAGSMRILPNYEWSYDGLTYRLAECGECGSASTSPLPSDPALTKLYSQSFDYRWYKDYYPAKMKDSQIRLVEYKSMLNGRILDFGGGLGYFSQVASDAGYLSETYDPYATPDSAKQSLGRWDTVVALHVLEHANDLDRICRQIKDKLVPGGTLILAVPNYDGLGYRRLGMRWVWAQPPLIHVHHFTAAGLAALLGRHGFTDIAVSYHDRWDANVNCDVQHATVSRWLDSAWGVRLLSRFNHYRRLVVDFNMRRRFHGLAKSAGHEDLSDADLSELQVTARLPG